jgi:hypothetical protein
MVGAVGELRRVEALGRDDPLLDEALNTLDETFGFLGMLEVHGDSS